MDDPRGVSNLEVIVREEDDTFFLYSREWKLLVQGTDLNLAYQQIRDQQRLISERFKMAGLEHELPTFRTKSPVFAAGRPSSLDVFGTVSKVLIVCSVLGVLVLLGSLGFVSQLQQIYQKAEKVTNPSPSLVGKVATGALEKVARSLEELTPERRETIKQSLRIIAREVEPYVNDMRSFGGTSSTNAWNPHP